MNCHELPFLLICIKQVHQQVHQQVYSPTNLQNLGGWVKPRAHPAELCICFINTAACSSVLQHPTAAEHRGPQALASVKSQGGDQVSNTCCPGRRA